MSDLENQLQEVINEAKFPGIDAGRVTKYSAVVSHNGVLGSHAVIFHHNDQTGEKTEHDRMGSSAKGHEKAIYANIKKKYGNVMFEGFEEEDQLDELNLDAHKLAQDRNSDEVRFNGRLKDPSKTLGQRGEPNRGEDPDGWARGGVSTKKRTRYEETENPIIEMIDSLMSGELVESNALFYDLLAYKINEKVELKKIEVAQGIFGESKDEDEDDNKSDEVGEDEENKHPLVQLNKIASSEEGIPLKYPETTASGEPDKRSIRAATDRIKSGKSTSGIPTFKHKNGEESVIHPDHAKHLSDILSGSTLKPDTKKAVLDTIHGSKAGLEKVSGILLNAKPNEKSAYGSKDARTA